MAYHAEVRVPRNHKFILTGDHHFGNAGCSMSMLRAIRDKAHRERNTRVILMGDLIEAITVDDFRFEADHHNAKLDPLRQMSSIKRFWSGLAEKGKIACILTGNHEEKLLRYGDLSRWMCEELKVPYGGYKCILDVLAEDDGELLHRIFLWHGHGSIGSQAKDRMQREANIRAATRRKMERQRSDCDSMWMGHVHRLYAFTPDPEIHLGMSSTGELASFIQEPRVSHIELADGAVVRYSNPDKRIYGITGTALRSELDGKTGYASKWGLDPGELGWAELSMRDGVLSAVAVPWTREQRVVQPATAPS